MQFLPACGDSTCQLGAAMSTKENHNRDDGIKANPCVEAATLALGGPWRVPSSRLSPLPFHDLLNSSRSMEAQRLPALP
jgi:hypothetical protein